jgi:dipeptidyl aminopeptidase/acylaminoacyl peptidase
VKEKYYENMAVLMAPKGDQDLTLDSLKIVISRESQTEPPQYYIVCWPDKRETQITNFPHPYPQLKDLKKEIIRYARSDGVQLTATLYTPPGYDPAKNGPVPTLMWAYPREFKSKDNASQMRGSPFAFAGIGSTSPLLWLARGFAILDGPTMPIIGEGDEEPNERYVEQLVASAQAAVDEVVKRGVADRSKIAVGGHSYGAFMTANLLIHASDLFSCGIARSGAYNRTLTPFGFQAEERTLWEAQKTYIDMSPYMYADRVKKPILLIHGDEDNNAGTMTMQSERFFSALKGHGALTRLVLLPLESHGYQGRESVMHCLWEMDRWLQTHCVNAVGSTPGPSSPTEADPVVSSSGTSGGGSAPECAPAAKTFTCAFGPLTSSL